MMRARFLLLTGLLVSCSACSSEPAVWQDIVAKNAQLQTQLQNGDMVKHVMGDFGEFQGLTLNLFPDEMILEEVSALQGVMGPWIPCDRKDALEEYFVPGNEPIFETLEYAARSDDPYSADGNVKNALDGVKKRLGAVQTTTEYAKERVGLRIARGVPAARVDHVVSAALHKSSRAVFLFQKDGPDVGFSTGAIQYPLCLGARSTAEDRAAYQRSPRHSEEDKARVKAAPIVRPGPDEEYACLSLSVEMNSGGSLKVIPVGAHTYPEDTPLGGRSCFKHAEDERVPAAVEVPAPDDITAPEEQLAALGAALTEMTATLQPCDTFAVMPSGETPWGRVAAVLQYARAWGATRPVHRVTFHPGAAFSLPRPPLDAPGWIGPRPQGNAFDSLQVLVRP